MIEPKSGLKQKVPSLVIGVRGLRNVHINRKLKHWRLGKVRYGEARFVATLVELSSIDP